MDKANHSLKRAISLPLITLYGLGNILGAGIYVLVGKVAATAGAFTPVSFLLASILAGLTAFSYMELSTRFPVSAGEAVYLQAGFNLKPLSAAVGILIVLAGIISAAAITRGFVGYFQTFSDWPPAFVTILLVITLGALAAWGIVESLRVAALLTLMEIFGLLLVIWVAFPDLDAFSASMDSMLRPTSSINWHGIILGGILAFYAYIGFEDMVNVAEEVQQPDKNMPRAILIALILSTILYMAIALVAVSSGPLIDLVNSDAPLAYIYQRATGESPWLITFIALFAVVNGALIQIIMASRVCYGMSRQGWIPAFLSNVNPVTGTPLLATVLVTSLLLIMALWFPIEVLARMASFLLLVVFSLVNLSLWRIKKLGLEPVNVFVVPSWVPIAGFISSSLFLGYQIFSSFTV